MINRTKVSMAVVVAAGLNELAQATIQDTKIVKEGSKGYRLLMMAADVLDHTLPAPEVLREYHFKDVSVSDAQFLAKHLALLEPLAEKDWPPRKVAIREWGEFTRILKGLDEVMGAASPASSERLRNRQALRLFVLKHIQVLAPTDQVALDEALHDLVLD